MPDPPSVFINIAYDHKREDLLIAYVAGLCALGMVPKIGTGVVPRMGAALPGSRKRLDRILELLKTCRYAVHDLSAIEVSASDPKTPRFNMPFELGLSVAIEDYNPDAHSFVTFDADRLQLKKSLSDFDSRDPYAHAGTPAGVLTQLLNAFCWEEEPRPTFNDLLTIFEDLKKVASLKKIALGTDDIVDMRAFDELVRHAMSTSIARLKALAVATVSSASSTAVKRTP